MKKQENSLISVIIPIYNVEKYLEDCISSVVNQSYTNLEILLIDDGSRDSCPCICDYWAKKDSRIKVIHKKNGGLSSARNEGITIATGKYLSFVDSDDYIEPDMLRTMVEAAERNTAEMVCCGRLLVLANGEKKRMHCLEDEKLYTSEQAIKEILMGRDIEEAAWDKLYLKKLFTNIRYPEGEINEDIVVIGPLIEKCNCIVHVGDPFYNYRVNENSITKSKYNSKKSIYLKHMQQVEEYVLSTYKEMNKELSCFLARYAYAELLDMEIDKKIIVQFKSDYCEYKKKLYENCKEYLKADLLSFKDKIQILLILMGLYGALIRVKKKYEYPKEREIK